MSTVSFRFVGDEARLVSILPSGELARIEPDQLFTVDGEFWESYACQPHYFEAQDEDPGREAMDAVLSAVDGLDPADRPEAIAVALQAERIALKPRPKLIAELEKRRNAERPADELERPDVPAQPGATPLPLEVSEIPPAAPETRTP